MAVSFVGQRSVIRQRLLSVWHRMLEEDIQRDEYPGMMTAAVSDTTIEITQGLPWSVTQRALAVLLQT